MKHRDGGGQKQKWQLNPVIISAAKIDLT